MMSARKAEFKRLVDAYYDAGDRREWDATTQAEKALRDFGAIWNEAGTRWIDPQAEPENGPKNKWGRTVEDELDWQLDHLKYALADMEIYFPEGEITPDRLDDIDAKIVMVIAFNAQSRVIEAYRARLAQLEGE